MLKKFPELNWSGIRTCQSFVRHKNLPKFEVVSQTIIRIMSIRARSPDIAHQRRCVERHGSLKKAVRLCNRCFYIKNRRKWLKEFDWLVESDETEFWGLSCKYCRDYGKTRPQDSTRGAVSCRASVWMRCKKGADGVLQKIDLGRHASNTDFHKVAMKAFLQGQSDSVAAAADSQSDECLFGPTAAQIRLALEVVRTPLGAQAAEFVRRAELANRSDASNYPVAHNKAYDHERIVGCLAKVLCFCRTYGHCLL